MVLDGYRNAESSDPLTRLGSPFLGWPSIFRQESDSYVSVVFSDAARPVSFGRFARVRVNPDERLEREERYSQDLAPQAPGPIRHFPKVQDAPDATWHLHLELADNAVITDERDWLAPGRWTVRLIVGADDGDAHAYDVDIAWAGDEPDAESALNVALDRLDVHRAR